MANRRGTTKSQYAIIATPIVSCSAAAAARERHHGRWLEQVCTTLLLHIHPSVRSIDKRQWRTECPRHSAAIRIGHRQNGTDSNRVTVLPAARCKRVGTGDPYSIHPAHCSCVSVRQRRRCWSPLRVNTRENHDRSNASNRADDSSSSSSSIEECDTRRQLTGCNGRA